MKFLEAKAAVNADREQKRAKGAVENKMLADPVENKSAGQPSVPSAAPSAETAWTDEDEQADITANARELARELQLRPSEIRGSGENGRITVADVRKAVEHRAGHGEG